MARLELFEREYEAGVFRGFTQGGLEFHADLLLPYQAHYHNSPMHGQFLLVQLESPDEAVLGRISSFTSEGKLSYGSGEEFALRAMRDRRQVPDDLREEYLRYRVSIRVLGVIRVNTGDDVPTFVPSHRRLPHVGSIVAFPSPAVLKEITGHYLDGADIGHFALGEYIYAQGSSNIAIEAWMQIKDPEIVVRFPMENLVSRRSFIFARAGFGKSNLNKLLFSQLYRQSPTVEKRGGLRAPVGTIIFDPDGEYFWPDDKGRPGLCDVPHLQDKLVVFTARTSQSPYYQSFVASGIKVDIRRLRPGDVIAIALSPEKQDQQNVRKLRSLNDSNWRDLVNLIYRDGNNADIEQVSTLLRLEQRQEAEALAARANMTQIVRQLHDPASQMIQMLLKSLENGKLCVIDVSQMRGSQGLILSGLILRQIFNHNQEQFTEADPKTIPTIAVIEEAQSVLDERASASQPYVEWVKEGRKYDLGSLMITQQPGSIPVEILSQGDNWFLFHLLSASDLTSVQKANSHFSSDLLSSLLNEPIPGQGVFWSSVGGKPYPIPIRVLSFENQFSMLDATYTKPAADTYAARLVESHRDLQAALESASNITVVDDQSAGDTDHQCEEIACHVVRGLNLAGREGNPIKWGRVGFLIKDSLPVALPNRESVAFGLVKTALQRVHGQEGVGWRTERVETDGKSVMVVRILAQDE